MCGAGSNDQLLPEVLQPCEEQHHWRSLARVSARAKNPAVVFFTTWVNDQQRLEVYPLFMTNIAMV